MASESARPAAGGSGQGHAGHVAAPLADRDDLWRLALDELLVRLGVTAEGLTDAEAEARAARYGPNDSASEKPAPLVLQFVRRFRNPLVVVLLVASGLSAAAGDLASFIIVASIVLASMSLDMFQEVRAQTAVEVLRRSVAVRSTVRRNGACISLPVDRLVPGDVVELAAGDLIPADCRIVKSRDLFINQALLTGEAYPVAKKAGDSVEGNAGATGASNAVFSGTSVLSGSATVVVGLTGAATALGELGASLAQKAPDTAFTTGLRRFGVLIARMTVLMVLFVLVVNIGLHRPVLQSLMFALALAVGLTPELLPMIVTVTLARSALRLARRRVIVKRLSAIHDLGAMDMLCTDKTGTLTEGRIKLLRTVDGNNVETDRVYLESYLNSHFESGMKSPLDDAILAARPCDVSGWTKVDEVPFDFERRRVSVLVEHQGLRRLIVKGAPEDVLRLSSGYVDAQGGEHPMDDATRRTFAQTLESFGAQGLRALGVASRDVGPALDTAAVGDETALFFVGFAVFLDPPKASAGTTVRTLAAAGVTVKVLTGDNEAVSRHVFAQIGVPVSGVLSGDAIDRLSEEALLGQLPCVNLFCRMNPQQKHRVLLALRRRGHVVGFLGDGINDAPALHAADVGISVDGAADVARAAADLILLEHDLAVVGEAVAQGRGTVRNVSKYVLMASSSNFGNMLSMSVAALFLPFLPMLPIQILLNNLLYDLSEIALPFDHVDSEATRHPVRWNVTLIERFMLVFGSASSLFDFLTFYVLLKLFEAGDALFQTGWFVESLVTQVLIVFAIRTRRRFYLSRPHRLLVGLAAVAVTLAVALPLSPIGHWFGFVAPPLWFFGYLIVVTVAYLGLVELIKHFFYSRRSTEHPIAPAAA